VRPEGLVPAVVAQVPVQVCAERLDLLHQRGVGRQRLELLAVERAQQRNRVMAFGPQSRVEALEQLLGGPVPRPAQIACQPAQGGDAVRENSTDRKSADCLHPAYGSADVTI
jgi:hypothetical protein